jgi:hypothetical protein
MDFKKDTKNPKNEVEKGLRLMAKYNEQQTRRMETKRWKEVKIRSMDRKELKGAMSLTGILKVLRSD